MSVDSKDDPKNSPPAFTLDTDKSKTGIPSITKLLNRKSLGLKSTPKPPPPPAPSSSPESEPASSSAEPSPTPPAEPESPPEPLLTEPLTEPLIEPRPPIEPESLPKSLIEPRAAPEPQIEPSLDSPAEALNAEPSVELSPELSSELESAIEFSISSAASASDSASDGGGIELASDAPATLEVESSVSAAPVSSSQGNPENPETSGDLSLSPEVGTEISAPVAIAEPSDSPVPSPTIHPSTRKSQPGVPNLILWDYPMLKSGADPLGKGIISLMDQGATSALFLAITPPPPGSQLPHFVGTAAVAPSPSRLGVWTGLRWDPTVVPELWNYFVKAGHAELSPPATSTNITSNRNVIRGAFGIMPLEWLLLVRVGSAQSCRGVISIVSTRSLIPVLPSALPLMSADFAKKT